jgi:hypothetical protein
MSPSRESDTLSCDQETFFYGIRRSNTGFTRAVIEPYTEPDKHAHTRPHMPSQSIYLRSFAILSYVFLTVFPGQFLHDLLQACQRPDEFKPL